MFETPVAKFSYRTIKPALFFGYSLLSDGTKMAYMEKAILDYFYLNPSVRSADDFASLRLNRQEIQIRVNVELLTGFLERFNHKRLSKTIKQFLGWLNDA
jgi:hypothetical protein